MIFGLPGFYTRLGNREGKLGAVGVIILIGGWIILMCINVLQLANIHGALVDSLSWMQLYSSIIGSILLSISIIRAAVYPRWTGVALLINVFMYLILGGALYPVLPVNPNVARIIGAFFPLIFAVVYIRCAFTLLESEREFAIPT